MPSMWRRCASLSKMPGSRLLMVTFLATVCRASPATKPTRPERAPFDRPSSICGVLTLRATMVISTPSWASATAQALPRPRLAPLNNALRPRIPNSTALCCDGGERLDGVAVLLVEPELLDDANALSQRFAFEVGERLAQV